MIFRKIIDEVKKKVENKSNTTLHISYSYQNKSSDTIAVSMNNKPFRNENGQLLFRPGGHGALIDNMNNLDADIVFIKNIDNVSQSNSVLISQYKKALAGILLEYQNQIFEYLNQIQNNKIQETDINSIVNFATQKLSIEIFDDFNSFSFSNKIMYLKQILNRPIRVCGMISVS